MTNKQCWKHGTWFDTGKPDAVAIFDDEDLTAGDDGCDAIYLMKDGKFSPCRTVYRGNFNHWKSVISAWISKADKVMDMRRNKTVPLP